MSDLKQICLDALKNFISESSNENKMELLIAFDEIEDAEKVATLGEELYVDLARIVFDNFHPDEYLEALNIKYFIR